MSDDTLPWKPAPTFEGPKNGNDDAGDELLSGEAEPQRSRKQRSDKGVPRGPRGEGRPGRRARSLKEPIAGMLVMMNLPVQMFLPTDALDLAEMDALASGLDEQCKVNPTFRRWVERMLGVASGGQLLAVSGMILARRGARHGLFGTSGQVMDEGIGTQLTSMTNQPHTTPEYAIREPATEQPVMPQVEDMEGTQIGGIPAIGGTHVA